MKSMLVAIVVVFVAASAALSQKQSYPKAKVSYDDFKGLVAEVEAHRARRLIDLDTFLRLSQEDDVIILDTRSDFRFERVHIKGAKHLAFTDFTQDNLARLIPNPNTTILIYCNNNFDGNRPDFATKAFVPPLKRAVAINEEAKPLMMALNIPTYINLYGYGYRNVYELDELVKVTDRRIALEGSTIEQQPTRAQRAIPSSKINKGTVSIHQSRGEIQRQLNPTLEIAPRWTPRASQATQLNHPKVSQDASYEHVR